MPTQSPSTFWAHYEPICEHAGLIRVFPDGLGYGDPYLFTLTVKIHTPTAHPSQREAFLMGLAYPTDLHHWRAICDALARAGFTFATWERLKAGKKRHVKIRLKATK